jgi:hypothetical protein
MELNCVTWSQSDISAHHIAAHQSVSFQYERAAQEELEESRQEEEARGK